MDTDELRFYYALYLSNGIGAQRLIALRTYFGDSKRAFAATQRQLSRAPGVGDATAAECVETRDAALRKASNDLDSISEDTEVVTFFDEDYPESLRNIYNPPALLFVRGERSLLSAERKLAVIGTRRITDYGKRVTGELCRTLAEHRVAVVSGFAVGVDTFAHHAAFDSGGTTIAVLGSGINVIYPPSNKSFAKEIIASGRGLIVSELSVGAKPDAKNFPWRNRIVSGLSAASVIIESDEKGGSMITASIALDQNREVFALPGDVDRPMSRGPNLLLAEGRAQPFRSASDILKSMEWGQDGRSKTGKSRKPDRLVLTQDEQQLYDLLELAGEPIHIDAIVDRSGLEVQSALVKLLELEFKDAVRQLPGKYFSTVF